MFIHIYMCFVCVLSGVGVYTNKSHINNGSWSPLNLFVADSVDDGETNCLISMPNVGNNLDVQSIFSNEDNDVFWILKWTSQLYVYEDDEKKTCAYKQSIGKGDDIVEGLYYKKLGRLNNLYVLEKRERKCFHVFSPHVCYWFCHATSTT